MTDIAKINGYWQFWFRGVCYRFGSLAKARSMRRTLQAAANFSFVSKTAELNRRFS